MEHRVGGLLPAELARVGHCAGAEGVATTRLLAQVVEDPGVVARIVTGHEESRAAVVDRGGQPAHRGGDHGGAARLRLDGDQTERLVVARHHGHVGRSVPAAQLSLRGGRREADEIGDPEIGGQLLQTFGVLQARAARTADDGHDEGTTQRRVGRHHLGRGPQEHVGGLQRLDPADEQQDEGIGGETKLVPGSGAVDRGEAVEVDARRHRGHRRGIGPVEVDELSGLLRGVGDESVGRLDDL